MIREWFDPRKFKFHFKADKVGVEFDIGWPPIVSVLVPLSALVWALWVLR